MAPSRNYESLPVQWGDPDKYRRLETIGGGRFSKVYRGIKKDNNEPCIFKVLRSVVDLQRKFKRELHVLRTLDGGPNIVKLLDVVEDSKSKNPCLILEHISDTNYKILYPTFTDYDIRFYIYELLRALEYCHSKGIMHRDIKPNNVMIDQERKILRLIDWGLAEFHEAGKEYNVGIGSRCFLPPELLVGIGAYDYAVDMWGVGCILAGMIFRKEKFFNPSEREDELVQIAKVLGTENLNVYLEKYGLELASKVKKRVGSHSRKPWADFINEENTRVADAEAVDLVDRLLCYDHRVRLTAKEAMEHPYFHPVTSVKAKKTL